MIPFDEFHSSHLLQYHGNQTSKTWHQTSKHKCCFFSIILATPNIAHEDKAMLVYLAMIAGRSSLPEMVLPIFLSDNDNHFSPACAEHESRVAPKPLGAYIPNTYHLVQKCKNFDHMFQPPNLKESNKHFQMVPSLTN